MRWLFITEALVTLRFCDLMKSTPEGRDVPQTPELCYDLKVTGKWSPAFEETSDFFDSIASIKRKLTKGQLSLIYRLPICHGENKCALAAVSQTLWRRLSSTSHGGKRIKKCKSSSDHLPDESLQDEGRRPLLKFQLFVVQSLGVGATLGGSLAEQHDAVVVPEGQRALEKRDTTFAWN